MLELIQQNKRVMEIYSTPKQGTYYFRVPNFDGTFKRYSTPVEVIAETNKSYRVILKHPIRGHLVGDKIWVIKKNVYIEEVVKKEIDVNEFWYSKD